MLGKRMFVQTTTSSLPQSPIVIRLHPDLQALQVLSGQPAFFQAAVRCSAATVMHLFIRPQWSDHR